MSEPGTAMQKAIYDALKADASLAGLMGGSVRVYDVVEPNAPFPYVTIGDDQSLDEGNKCEPDMFEYYATLHVWSRSSPVGRVEAKNIAGRVREIFKALPAPVGFDVKSSTCERLDHLRDPDGLSAHSIVTMRFLITIN
jgi:hypothetical protein